MTQGANAFIPGDLLQLKGKQDGPLSGLRFAAKDLFDVRGHVTGCGNPDWKRTHSPAQRTAKAVDALLAAGANLSGKTITDELAFSLEGRNVHYGTPLNPAAPGRIPGGSSSGSASAVASDQVDFALGTDTGGSVRIPAALCGLYGIRPSHGSVSLEGVMPFAPSFDTVGWMARKAELLSSVGDVLLPESDEVTLAELLVIEEMETLSDRDVAESFAFATTAIEGMGGVMGRMSLEAWTGMSPEAWTECFRTLQGYEIAEVHRSWIASAKPEFDPEIAYRFEWAQSITKQAAEAAAPLRDLFSERLSRRIAKGTVLCLPTAPTLAPEVAAPVSVYRDYRRRTLISTAISGLARCPQVTLPIPTRQGGMELPVGLSLIGPRGSDRALLTLAGKLASELAAARS